MLATGLLVAAYTLVYLTEPSAAGFENVCTYSDYFGSRVSITSLNRCGSKLTDYVIAKCGGTPYLGRDANLSGIRKKRDLAISKDEAHSYLRTKRSFNQGIVCECCLNHCTAQEFDQYCSMRRRRRSVRDVFVSNSDEVPGHLFKAEEIEQLYEDIDKLFTSEDSAQTITSEEYKLMQLIEDVKRENINKEYNKVANEADIKEKGSIGIGVTTAGYEAPALAAEITAPEPNIAASTKHHKRRHHHRGNRRQF